MKPGLPRYRVKPIPDREYLGHPKDNGRMDLGVPGHGVITVPMSMLIPVHPDQPTDRTMVHVAGNYYQRLGLRADGKHWYMPGQQYGHSWPELCGLGTPVAVVPDPLAEAPKLPYTHVDADGDRISVDDTGKVIPQGTEASFRHAVYVDRPLALAVLRATKDR